MDMHAPLGAVTHLDGSRGGWWNRKVGGKKVVWDELPPPSILTPSKPPGRPMPIPSTSSHSAAQGLLAPATTIDPLGAQLAALDPTLTAFPNASGTQTAAPLPDEFWKLPWKERRRLEKMRAEQEKMVREYQKAQRDWEKAMAIDAERRYKAELKAKKKELKAQEKLLRQQRKHPNRYLPHPTSPTGNTQAAPASSKQQAQTPTKFMMLPTQEEFGFRRPFDVSGRLPITGEGEWPMMSRTMTHALIDMGREERVHAVSAGTVWGGGWGGQR